MQHEFDGKRIFFYSRRQKRIWLTCLRVAGTLKKMIIEHTEVEDSLKGQGLGLIIGDIWLNL